MGFDAAFYMDSLSCLFALLITFIGTLVVICTGQYFKGDPTAWRFLTFLLLFMASMLGLVMAGDVLTLFMFWEGNKHRRRFCWWHTRTRTRPLDEGAFRALLYHRRVAVWRCWSGVAFVSSGSRRVPISVNSGYARGAAPRQPTVSSDVGVSSLSGRSQKAPSSHSHIWLPHAMSAPAPASAYLHSATMVKAGIYLLARLNPVWVRRSSGLICCTTRGTDDDAGGRIPGLETEPI